MTKKALKVAKETVVTRSLENAPSRDATRVKPKSLAIIQADDEDVRQEFSSEDQAIDFLLGSVVDKLSENPEDRAEMADFLGMLLDTDPALKEEILANVSIRKS
ncbi:MAG: hypothetical protein RL326_400 [Pseudomonadota bacterium]|jgi:hypothetical protein